MWEGGVGPFLPSLGTYMAQEWSKIRQFLGQKQATMAGWVQGGDPAWKVFSVPYHTPMHGTTLFRPTFALSRHQSRVPGVQNMAIFWVKIKPLWRAGSRVGIPPGKCLVYHITPQCMEQHYLGPLLPSPGTHPGFQGSKNGYFLG